MPKEKEIRNLPQQGDDDFRRRIMDEAAYEAFKQRVLRDLPPDKAAQMEKAFASGDAPIERLIQWHGVNLSPAQEEANRGPKEFGLPTIDDEKEKAAREERRRAVLRHAQRLKEESSPAYQMAKELKSLFGAEGSVRVKKE